MNSIYWKTDGENSRCTNICYNCVDRHVSSVDKNEVALLWEGNFWNDDVHDYASVTWDTVDVLTNKIADVFKKYCKMGDKVMLFLHNVIQLPMSMLAASKIGVISVILNPAAATLSELTNLLKETCPKLIVTVDGFWQGNELFETKKQLDKAIENAQVSSIDHVLVIRHTGPNPGVPPPERIYPGRRPCYSLEVPINDTVDVLWSKQIASACTRCEPVWLTPNYPFAIIPQWTPDLYLRIITNEQILQAAWEFSLHVLSPCLSLAHPQSPLGLVGCIAPWLTGKSLAIFEGTLYHPDPSRLKQIVAKFELKSVVLPKCRLNPEYMEIVPVPTLSRIVTEPGNKHETAKSFLKIEVVELNVEELLR